MKTFLFSALLMSFAANAAEWKHKAYKLEDNGDDTTTVLYPHKEGPYGVENVCGGLGDVAYSKWASKNRICKRLGLGKYVKGSVEYRPDKVLMSRVLMDKVLCGGWGCCGAPIGEQQGIHSLRCRKIAE